MDFMEIHLGKKATTHIIDMLGKQLHSNALYAYLAQDFQYLPLVLQNNMITVNL